MLRVDDIGQLKKGNPDKKAAKESIYDGMGHEEICDHLLEYAAGIGYMAYYPSVVKDSNGKYRTVFKGHSGFPDLVLVGSKVFFIEVKTVKDRLRSDQKIWRNKICDVEETHENSAVLYYTLKPSGIPKMMSILIDNA